MLTPDEIFKFSELLHVDIHKSYLCKDATNQLDRIP